jgi:biotin carboxylase
MTDTSFGFLCIATYFKGTAFLKALKEAGNRVYLVTAEKHRDKAWGNLDEIFYLPNPENTSQNLDQLIAGTAHLMRSRKIDRIVALDDFDVEKAALLRENFRIPGFGQTTARFFRDKLAMRVQAQEIGIKIPPFSSLFHDLNITEYLQTVDGPWVIKPRAEASATGIRKVHTLDHAWEVIHSLGENRHNFLIEQFKPGDVFHVDSLVQAGKVVFDCSSRYLSPPLEVSHEGGIFRSVTLQKNDADDKALKKMNEQILKTFGLENGASHTEIIKSKATGELIFLETSARVGGANLAEMVEFATGINLWREWAKLESALLKGEKYKIPKLVTHYAGIVISLSRFQFPDMSSFIEEEIVWKMQQEHHIGFIVKSAKQEKIVDLLENYTQRIFKEYHASAPSPNRPAS